MAEHQLESEWTFWFERRDNRTEDEAKGMSQMDWEQKLQKIGTFNTLENFWSYYCHLQRPTQLPRLSSYHLFRGQTKPTWENYPEGGHWLITMKKTLDDKTRLNRLWEQLMFALIGEEFEDPDVIGIVVQIRIKEDVLSVWLADKAPKFRVGEKLKQILHLGPSTVIEYKNNKTSLKDHSGLRNAQAYCVGEDERPATTACVVSEIPCTEKVSA
jgi:translation initiation factor 4E